MLEIGPIKNASSAMLIVPTKIRTPNNNTTSEIKKNT